ALLVTHHHTAADKGGAAAQVLAAGLDVELPRADCFGTPLRDLAASGMVPMALVDRAVTRVLASKMKLGLFENPYVDASVATVAFDTVEDRTLARDAATASIVLVTNNDAL